MDQLAALKLQAEEKKREILATQQKKSVEEAQASVIKRQDSSQLYTLPPDATAFEVNQAKNGFESNFSADFDSAFGKSDQEATQNGTKNVSNGGESGKQATSGGAVLVKYR